MANKPATRKILPPNKRPPKPAATKRAAAPAANSPAPGRALVVPLTQLAISKANARLDETPPLGDLLASLPAEGLLMPLLVRAGKGGVYDVIDGKRRLLALKQLAKARTSAPMPIDFDKIPIFEIDAPDDAEAREKSLAVGTVILPLHIADQFEGFRDLANDRGLDAKEIAGRFGVPTKQVERALRLGELAPAVIAAFRAGDFAYETACAFALVKDHKRQLDALKWVKKQKHDVGAWSVRRQLIGDESHSASEKSVAFLEAEIGAENVRKAGVEVLHDLFDDRTYISGADKVQKLVADAIERRVSVLKAQDWKWVADATKSYDLHYAPQQKAKGRGKDKWPAEQRAQLGCAVWFEPHDGKMVVREGLLDPAEQRRKERAAANKGENGAGGSAASAIDALPKPAQKVVHGQLFAACVRAIESDPALAQLALTAQLIASGNFGSSALDIEFGADAPNRLAKAAEFADATSTDIAETARRIQKMTAEEQEDLFASVIAMGVSSCAGDYGLLVALLSIASGETRLAALRAAFEPTALFEKLPKKRVMEMLRAVPGPAAIPTDVLADLDKLKGEEFVPAAAAAMKGSGWIPDELYVAPAAGDPEQAFGPDDSENMRRVEAGE